jgi:hypothetical protein
MLAKTNSRKSARRSHWRSPSNLGAKSVLAKFVQDIDSGAHIYWQRRISPHPMRWSVLFILFCVIGLVLLTTVRPEFSLAWLAIGVSFLVGDVSALIRVARCKNCGFRVSPAPTYRTECPSCGHIIWP